jgi:hypothetical protein
VGKLRVQQTQPVLQYSGSLAGNQTISGSAYCNGYAFCVGAAFSSGSSETGSGLRVLQSVDHGEHWDLISSSTAFGAGGGSAAFDLTIQGDALKVILVNGATVSSCARLGFWLQPV